MKTSRYDRRKPGDSLVRLPQVQFMTGLSKATIYRYIDEGSFPSQVQIGPQAVAWSRAAVQEWVDEKLDNE